MPVIIHTIHAVFSCPPRIRYRSKGFISRSKPRNHSRRGFGNNWFLPRSDTRQRFWKKNRFGNGFWGMRPRSGLVTRTTVKPSRPEHIGPPFLEKIFAVIVRVHHQTTCSITVTWHYGLWSPGLFQPRDYTPVLGCIIQIVATAFASPMIYLNHFGRWLTRKFVPCLPTAARI